jgi:hypothetical protein
MAAFGFRTRRTRRAWTVAATTAIVAAAILLVAGAATGTLSGSSFNTTNGSLEDPSHHDWNPPRADSPGPPADPGNLGPVETITCPSSAPGGGTNCGLDLTGSASDDSFAQGPKEDDVAPAVGTGGIPPNKDDLSRFYINQEHTASADFLYLAWERTNLLGSAHMDFEFNQSSTASANGVTKVRTAGDLLISFDFGGSGTPTLDERTWVVGTNSPSTDCDSVSSGSNVSCWSKPTDLTASGFADGSVNGANVVDRNAPGAPRTLTGTTTVSNNKTTVSSTFGEAGINLTAANVFPRNTCVHFGAASLKSRSSGNSFTSTLKDFIAPIPVNISNCGTVIIRKVTSPSPDPTDTTFAYTTTGGLTPAPSLKNGQNKEYDNVPAGNYSVTETDPSPNFAFASLDCSASSKVHGSTTSISSRTVNITLAAGDTIDCTYTNNLQRGAIQVTKVSSKGSAPLAGATFSYTGSDNVKHNFPAATDSSGQACVGNLALGTYTVAEESAPSGYAKDANSQSVTVSSAGTCASGATSAPSNFVDTPLSKIEVKFTSLAGAGVTTSQIVCKQGTTVVPAVSENGSNDNETTPVRDDTDEVFGNESSTLTPGVYTCTIDVDP